MSNPLDPDLIVLAIQSGKFDVNLDAFAAVIAARKSVIAESRTERLKPGDSIIIGNCRPKKYEGQLAEFVRFEKNWLVTRLQSGATLRLKPEHVQHVIPSITNL